MRGVSPGWREVIVKLKSSLPDVFMLEQYGALSHAVAGRGFQSSVDNQFYFGSAYPLFAARSRDWDEAKPCVLVTGGVHGYETSGVHGALSFLQNEAAAFSTTFNIVVAPCVSPWAYEHIQRWNPLAVDPNRSFNPHGPRVEGRPFNPEPATEESRALLQYLGKLKPNGKWTMHIDCHETTDSDATEFTPARNARDGRPPEIDLIPDGFFLVAGNLMDGYQAIGEHAKLQAWHTAIIEGVRKVTHIAPAEADGTICHDLVIQPGVVGIPNPSEIGLCAGATNATYAVTTEVYPDSRTVDGEQCNRAQVAAITSGLRHLISEGVAG